MQQNEFHVAVDGSSSVTALRTAHSGKPSGWTFIYAPGAGSNLNDPFGKALASAFAEKGIEVIRFQFPYAEAKRRFPDRNDVLESTWDAVIRNVVGKNHLAAGGRSMGGQIASQVAAKGAPVDALVLFAYPLHPPGEPEKLRTAHLNRVPVRTLFCSGTVDEFGTPDELRAAAALVPDSTLGFLEGADHSFSPAKGMPGSRQGFYTRAIDAALEFLLKGR